MAPLTHNIQKKQHRERSQPQERKKWGLLEKKKDYKLRARDFHAKEARLKILRQKARDRNPDEFYYGMTSHKTDARGVLIAERGTDVLSVDAAKLLKTQDSGYIKTLTNLELNKVEKLEKELMFQAQGNHTVFVDDRTEVKKFSAAKYFQTPQALLDRRENRLRTSQLESDVIAKALTQVDSETARKAKLSKYKELDQRINRTNELKTVQKKMDLQRELMKKGEKKKIVAADGSVSWKWNNVRKR